MEHNSLTGIACARPIIYAEGLFAPCILENGKFIPEEGLSQQDLWSILNGEFFKSGSDLVEDFTLKSKLEKLTKPSSSCYELDYFPRDKLNMTASSEMPSDDKPVVSAMFHNKGREDVSAMFLNKGRGEDVLLRKDGIPLVRFNSNSTEEENDKLDSSCDMDRKLRDFFEKQITWILEEDEGEDFVVMEMCSRFNDTLVLLDLLKQHNIPCVLSFLARRNEPVAVSFSKIQIGLDGLMFCLFQA